MFPAVQIQLSRLAAAGDGKSEFWQPLERGRIEFPGTTDALGWVELRDGRGLSYGRFRVSESGWSGEFTVRGALGWHSIWWEADAGSAAVCVGTFRVVAQTSLECDQRLWELLFSRVVRQMLHSGTRPPPIELEGRAHAVEVCWSRDHAFTLKATRYFRREVTSGTELWLRTQRPDGSFWDCWHANPSGQPNWFCEALGEGWFAYYEKGRWMARRIPIEADVEYCITEAVFHGWQATGDTGWVAGWLDSLERARLYTLQDPRRWNERHGLVTRSFCMDSWDFAHPAFCAGDHRCLHPEDPAFLFHGDNSGFYQQHRQLAVLWAAVGKASRAEELLREAEVFRARANEKLFRETHYGHMIPAELDEEAVFAVVGNEWERLSLSTGYTINRGLPTAEMARKILDEYQRRREARAGESFAEWWTMDPPYSAEQWPANGPAAGEYMNGGICLIAAGELAKAACDHGRESYAADILRRVAQIAEQKEGEFFEVYRRLPEGAVMPVAEEWPIDLRGVVNRGLRYGQHPGVAAWTDEGENDLRGLPVGRGSFAGVGFEILDPQAHGGCSVLHLGREDASVLLRVPAEAAHAASLAFLHATAVAQPRGTPVAIYHFLYADGTRHPVFIRAGFEIGHWWNPLPESLVPPAHYDEPTLCQIGWQGPNGVWKNTGVFVASLANPHPEKALTAIEVDVSPLRACAAGGLMLCAVTARSAPAGLGLRTHSGGLPLCWALASVFHGLMNGMAGIEDQAAAFSRVLISPRWTCTEARHVRACLHYPASDTYCAYEFVYDEPGQYLRIDVAGNFQQADFRVLLPVDFEAKQVTCGEVFLSFSHLLVDQSRYVVFSCSKMPAAFMQIALQPIP